MKKFVNRALIRGEETAAIPVINRTITALHAVNIPQSKMLAACTEDWRGNRFTTEEQQWLAKIRQQRTLLERRNDVVEIDDFGAGVSPASDGIKKHVRVGDVAVQNSRSHRWLSFMMKLVRGIRPESILELGTCIGISGMYCSSGLQLNGSGTLITVEGANAYADIAGGAFQSLGLNNIVQYRGRFSDVLDGILNRHRPFDLVFVDGHHDGDATIGYFEQILPALSGSAWMIFDDISWSGGMKKAWKVISSHPRVKFSADLSLIGICFIQQ